MPLQVRTLSLLVIGSLICSCAEGPTYVERVEPLLGATSVPVSIVEARSIPLAGLPRLAVAGISGGVEITWELESSGCLTGVATAQQAASVVQIEIRQSLDPRILCARNVDGYRYVARVTGLAPRQYEIRLLAAKGGNAGTLAGRRSAVVLP